MTFDGRRAFSHAHLRNEREFPWNFLKGGSHSISSSSECHLDQTLHKIQNIAAVVSLKDEQNTTNLSIQIHQVEGKNANRNFHISQVDILPPSITQRLKGQHVPLFIDSNDLRVEDE